MQYVFIYVFSSISPRNYIPRRENNAVSSPPSPRKNKKQKLSRITIELT